MPYTIKIWSYDLIGHMRVSIRVKANSKCETVEKTGERALAVSVKAPAKEGRANAAVIAAISEYFDVPKSRISIISGAGSRDKIVEII